MTPLDVWNAFLVAKHRTYFDALDYVLLALEPFAARGIKPDMVRAVTPEDQQVALHLLDTALEALANVKAKQMGQDPSRQEGNYRRRTDGRMDENAFVECLARIVMQPNALTPLERRVALIGQAAREDRWSDVAALVASGGGQQSTPDIAAAEKRGAERVKAAVMKALEGL